MIPTSWLEKIGLLTGPYETDNYSNDNDIPWPKHIGFSDGDEIFRIERIGKKWDEGIVIVDQTTDEKYKFIPTEGVEQVQDTE